MSASAGCTQAGGVVDCELGALAPGEREEVTIVVTPRRTGAITNTATLASAVADPDPGDNTATATTTVGK